MQNLWETFLREKETTLYNSKMPQDKASKIIHHLAEGCGIRKTCRLTGGSRDAVRRLNGIAGKHARSIHNKLVRDLRVQEAQMDEKWGFVGKKERSSKQ